MFTVIIDKRGYRLKKYEFTEALAVSAAVIAFMLILALNKVYPIAYFWPVLLILLWPGMLLFRVRMKSTLTLSIVLWIIAGAVLFVINYLSFRRSDTAVWWFVYPMIGMFFWPLCEVLRYYGRRNK